METLYAVDLAGRIHYGCGVGGRAHLAGVDRVEVVDVVASEILGGNHAGRFVKLGADQRGKRILLIVENLKMLFSDLSDSDAGWRH